MRISALLVRLCLVLQFSFCLLLLPPLAVAQEIKVTDALFDKGTGKWLKDSIEKYEKEIKENKLDDKGRRSKTRLLDELCTKLPDELDDRLKKELIMGDSDRDKLHAHYLRETRFLLNEKCWCKLFKKWNLKGKFGFVDTTAAEICPELFPAQPKEGGGGKDEPKPTPAPSPSPKDGPTGGVKERFCPKGLRLIDDCVKEGVSITITGDGTATSHCNILLRDKKSGRTSSALLETICMSPKTKLPPPPAEVAEKNNIHYRLGPPAPAFVAQTLNAADTLDEQGKYANVPIPLARRKATITQLAIWQNLGGTGKSKDAINRDNVKEDMLKKAAIKASELSESEDKKLCDKVDLICEAVDLTCKETTTTTTERRKIKRDKPGIPVPEDPPGRPTTDGGRPEKPTEPGDGGGGGGERPEKPEEPGCPQHEIVCIPELTTFECENSQYQTMCTVTDTVIECPVDGSTVEVNVPYRKECRWSPCEVVPIPHVLPLSVKKDGMENPKVAAPEERARHAKDLAAHNKAISDATAKAKEANAPRATAKVAADGPFVKGEDLYVVYLCIDSDGKVREVYMQLLTDDEARLWHPDSFHKAGNQEKRETVIQNYRNTGKL